MRISEKLGMEHVGYNEIAAVFGSAGGYGIRQSAGHICSTDSFEFRSLSVAAFKVCHMVASRLNLLPLIMAGIVLPNASFGLKCFEYFRDLPRL
jgi:hypothetical protein